MGPPRWDGMRGADGGVKRGVTMSRVGVDVRTVLQEQGDDRGTAEIDRVVEWRVLRGRCVVRVCTSFQDVLDDGGGTTGAEVLEGCIVPDTTVFKDELWARVSGSEDGEEVSEVGGGEEEGKHTPRGEVSRDVESQLWGE